jgi:mRNA interferase MazF
VERLVKADVVVLPFPFSDLTAAKRRPALVVATLSGDDVILCQITSRPIRDEYAIDLRDTDFRSGSLKVSSAVRPNRLFTADRKLILYRAATVNAERMHDVTEALIRILRQ